MNAQEYDKAAVLEQEVGRRLLERLDFIKINPKILLDLGGGTGIFTQALQSKYPNATVLNLDLCEHMLEHTQYSLSCCANMLSMPFKTHSVDLIFSNCVFHNAQDLNELFSEIARVLKPEGLLLFSSFGPDTLKELHQTLDKLNFVDIQVPLVDMHDIGDVLIQHAFSDPVMDAENIEMHYSTFNDLMIDLKNTGSHNMHLPPGYHLTPYIQQDYEVFRRARGELPATFEIIYGLAWSADRTVRQTHAATSKTIPIQVL